MHFIIFFIFIWYASLFFQSFFQHRYAAHGAFKMSHGWERVFYILTYLAQGSSYMSPRAYAIMHRMHHAYTDTVKDPHSPMFSSNLFSMMWRTRTIYLKIYRGTTSVEERFLKNLPDWGGFDKWAHHPLSRIGWGIIYISVFIWSLSSWWTLALLPVIFIMGAFHGAIINWFAHKYGYTNFRLKNTSRNLLSIDMLMLGESYHNNHHKRPSSVNFGSKWHEIDPVYPVIRIMAWLHVIQLPIKRDTEMQPPPPLLCNSGQAAIRKPM